MISVEKQMEISKKMWTISMIAGIIGAVLMAASDWMMIYGDTAYTGKLVWLTKGVLDMDPGQNALAMMLAFPAVLFYSIALVSIRHAFKSEKERKNYTFITILGLTPWLCLHLFYTMIFYMASWLHMNGYGKLACLTGEAVFEHFGWIVIAGEVFMVLPWIYLFVKTLRNRTHFHRLIAFDNPLLIYVVLKCLTAFMPDRPFRLAFTNGLMSEAMIIFFIIYLIFGLQMYKK